MIRRLALRLVALAVVVAAIAGALVTEHVDARSRAVSTAHQPAGWAGQQQGLLSFALPPGFVAVAPGTGIGTATAQWTKPAKRAVAPPPAVVLYVESGAVGPLAARAALVTRSRSAELGVQPSRPVRPVPVPGSVGAASAEWTWNQPLRSTAKPVASRQVEVLVQTRGAQQFGLSLGGPASYLTDQIVDDFLRSISVASAAP